MFWLMLLEGIVDYHFSFSSQLLVNLARIQYVPKLILYIFSLTQRNSTILLDAAQLNEQP